MEGGPKQQTKAYRNDEPVRECPYCGEEHAGRGMYNHVNLTDGNGHAPAGEVPDGFDVSDAPITDHQGVTLNRDSEYQTDHTRWVCNFCGSTHKGKSGLGVHLRNKAGNPLHPEELADGEINYEPHHQFPATADGEILVPDQKYAGEVKLTHDEERRGFTVKVDKSLSPVSESVTVFDSGKIEDNTEVAFEDLPVDLQHRIVDELLEDIRAEFKQEIAEGNMVTDIPSTFKVVRDAVKA